MQAKWMLKRCKKDVKAIAKMAGISEVVASILVNREIETQEEIKSFINPSMRDLQNPLLMKDMERGVDIIYSAIKEGKNIAVYGDYDVDGVMSTYILYCGLLRCGAMVKYHIPDRITEGYGINIHSIEKLKEDGIQLIITCDNGISALDQIKRAVELNMQVVITDHHDIPFSDDEDGKRKFLIPEADAVIDPKQQDCKYPFKKLCGAGVAFKFIQVLYDKFNIKKEEALKFIEYAAIGTICDVVDLIGENRIIAKKGLGMLNNTENLGIRELIKETSLEDKMLNSYHIGFVIGPCINATGRLESAVLALELLLCKDPDRAHELAKKLHELNIHRQDMTIDSLNKIIDKVEKSDLKKDKVLVVYEKGVHESIAGIVAGRLKERYNVPSIVITNGKDFSKGSGRSIEGYNMFEELVKCKELMCQFGGHPLAAGLSIEEENIDKLRDRLNKNCKLTDEDIIPKIRIDKQVPLNSISFKMIEDIKRLEPFGKGNSTPVFGEKNVDVFRIYFIGKDKNTLKLFCRLKNSLNKIDALSFDGGEKFRQLVFKAYGSGAAYKILNNDFKNLKMDFIYLPSVNEYKGNKNIQLILKDFRLA
ncbi:MULTISPECIES: single-stranded-DNA-specific exonuclease RecJ [Clostridium]|uniref:Single-stranded-DNA-specific exonuclease RecJ n=1 Tax=Clostridium ragsdalei P11 TaxID=1353534 RepID=A0A1A6AY79_9CLOT|nr:MULTISPECIES: single-stranded-DNA-specific exonuclease RecJ [Clostridium]OBR95041.1 single-stranded-DNA-specific exonuclease RecJ [Clostridium ragsdalei P11]QXE20203.1 single-stranded-DNA-specific exonuclease RecJ [Clostridium sp. 001]